MKLFTLFVLFFTSTAFSYVQVNPVRFYIKDAKFGHFTVRNTQNKPVIVEIENKYFEMKSDGKMLQDNKNAVDELKKILFTPKKFVLNPGEKQVVRFFVKESLNIPELRTFAHLLTELQTNNLEKETKNSPSMSLTAKVALAIPVIYRTQLDKNNIDFTNETFSQKENDCIFSANWSNKTHSSYINFVALDEDGKEIFKLNGISNYRKDYLWHLLIPKIKCTSIKKIKIFDLDNEVNIISRDNNL